MIYTEADMIGRLRRRYSAPQFAFLSHVPDQTGGATRTADGVAMGLWRSRGLHLHGFEVKVQRRDWLKELRTPEKAEQVGQFCDYFWAVSPDDKIVKPGELPPRWGLLVVRGGGLGVKVKAERNPDALQPTKLFLAALLRRVWEQHPSKDALAQERRQGREEGRREAETAAGHRESRSADKVRRLEGIVAAFEEASGVRFARWGEQEEARRLGEIAKALRHPPTSANRAAELERTAQSLEANAALVRMAAAGYRRLHG